MGTPKEKEGEIREVEGAIVCLFSTILESDQSKIFGYNNKVRLRGLIEFFTGENTWISPNIHGNVPVDARRMPIGYTLQPPCMEQEDVVTCDHCHKKNPMECGFIVYGCGHTLHENSTCRQAINASEDEFLCHICWGIYLEKIDDLLRKAGDIYSSFVDIDEKDARDEDDEDDDLDAMEGNRPSSKQISVSVRKLLNQINLLRNLPEKDNMVKMNNKKPKGRTIDSFSRQKNRK